VRSPEAEALHHYLQQCREALLWKLEGLTESQVRRPMTPTGTNLLGLVKHAAFTESGYLGDIWGRPFPALAWTEEQLEEEPNFDFFATEDESMADIVDLYRQAWAHDDATLDELPLDAVAEVPWWRPGSRSVTLHRITLHTIVDLSRHAGHTDILREIVDGAVGLTVTNDNIPTIDWGSYRQRLEAIASSFD
jgi:uncharacterized damage-inducible protein DinB